MKTLWPIALALQLLVALVPCAFAQPVGGADVTFPVSDIRSGEVQLRGKLWSSPSATAAVILLHGSAGWSDSREGHYARAFSEAGFTVLAVDSFGPRGIATTTEDQSQVSSLQMARDGFAASRYLRERGFPMTRQAIMGFSKGGAAALFAADRTFLPQEPERFAAALAFYPACVTRPRVPKPASPVLMALGERDDYAGVKPCQEIASAFGAAGGAITVNIYPGATHTFDGDPAHSGVQQLRVVENFMDCRLYVEEDGSMTLGESRFPAGDPKVMAAMRSACMRHGATIWTNTRQKMQATKDALRFMEAEFDRKPP